MSFPFKHIDIKIIPHGCMRDCAQYGDYSVDEKGTLNILISEYENPDIALYVAIHELVEAWRCAKKGIPFDSIDAFDDAHKDHFDPGFLPDAPYHHEHVLSTELEYLMARQYGYDFSDLYDTKPIGMV